MEIRPVAAELCTPGSRTDKHDEEIVAFRSFATAPKHGTVWNTNDSIDNVLKPVRLNVTCL
jgi:hypothetical protein